MGTSYSKVEVVQCYVLPDPRLTSSSFMNNRSGCHARIILLLDFPALMPRSNQQNALWSQHFVGERPNVCCQHPFSVGKTSADSAGKSHVLLKHPEICWLKHVETPNWQFFMVNFPNLCWVKSIVLLTWTTPEAVQHRVCMADEERWHAQLEAAWRGGRPKWELRHGYVWVNFITTSLSSLTGNHG